jgi:methylenetetrahydrofolate dehydrogenase (NADP+) / methenyltetrahydrofolate cyclohydrolase
MTAKIIDGVAIAAMLRDTVAQKIATVVSRDKRRPGLAVVLVGDDPASDVYVRSKARQSLAVGMVSFEHRLPAAASEAQLLSLVATLNADDQVDGILVQLPLPHGIDSTRVIEAISPEKDVDGFHPINAGRLATGMAAWAPCTPLGAVRLLKSVLPSLRGLHAVVVGRSNIVGKPMAQLLLKEDATVTVAHSHTANLPAMCRTADILVAAVGRPEMVKSHWIKPGAVVIDVGINRLAPLGNAARGRLIGDVAFAEALEVAGAITPVPGGVGPMTIACLLVNTMEAYTARRRQ